MKSLTNIFKDWRSLAGVFITAPLCLWILLSPLTWLHKLASVNLLLFSFAMLLLHKDKGIRHATGRLKTFSLAWLVVSMVVWTIVFYRYMR